MHRRTFTRLCGGLLSGAAVLHREQASANVDQPWPRTRLVDTDDQPITPESLTPGQSLIFHYPFQVTPCFLVRLSPAEAAATGEWRKGLGDERSVVAFSAICSHKMSHPARPISHIAYRSEAVDFVDPDGVKQSRKGMISCCSERSVYDPADGARVLSGPAPVPLAGIQLELDDDGVIVAAASLGDNRYEEFLDAFGFRLALEHGTSDVRKMSGVVTQAVPAESFSQQQIKC